MPEMKTLTVNGVTYDIRDSSAVPATRTVNSKPLDTDILLTAADVGARADSWMPTAEDVGARANTWMPTAADVGAKEADWMPTLAELGALASSSKSITDCNSATANGWYVTAGASNAPTNYSYGWMLVSSRSGSGGMIRQDYYTSTNTPYHYMRYCVNGTWGEWKEIRQAIGAAKIKKAYKIQPAAAGWYRVGEVKAYNCHRLTLSTIWNNVADMSVIIDIAAPHSNPTLTKTAAAYSQAGTKIIDKVRLIKSETIYYVDFHYTTTKINDVYALLDGAEGWFTPYETITNLGEDSLTATVTLAL